MARLLFAYMTLGFAVTFEQIRGAGCHVVGVGCKDMDEAICQQTLTPVAGAPAERSPERPAGDLHPDSPRRQLLKDFIFALDP